jgi:hypothetical protein
MRRDTPLSLRRIELVMKIVLNLGLLVQLIERILQGK